MRMPFFSSLGVMAILCLGVTRAQTPQPAAKPDRIDFLTFAQGAIPVSVGGAGARLGANFESAVRITDGDATPFTVVTRSDADADTEFVYHLPAATTFDRFAVPNVLETPSPNTTFTRVVEVYGSTMGATEGFFLLASKTLQTHAARGQMTEIAPMAKRPVRWVKVRLVGGISPLRAPYSFEFSELIGNGIQDIPERSTHFTGSWRTQANRVRLVQKGPVVSGCYDEMGDLTGTVSGNILRATGLNRSDKTPSQFILAVAPDGSLRGVRSSNNGPFRLYSLAAATNVAECQQPVPPTLGCGSVIHGITFAYDSADIRPDSQPVLDELFAGLRATTTARILIEGHTSSEGTDEYNQRLSERRAQAVVAELATRGLARARLSATGIGERRPIAPNDNESGRSMNRRVEVKCQ